MTNQITPYSPPSTRPLAQRTWSSAYVRFLLSPKESLLLKIAPLAFVIGAPEVVASEFLPIIGEVSDLGVIILAMIVFVRTLQAVRRYR